MMRIEANEPCPLPDDPVLAEAAVGLRDCGEWGWLVDRDWRLVYVTDEQRRSLALGAKMVEIVIGVHIFGPEVMCASRDWLTGGTWSHFFEESGGLVLADTPGGRDELRARIDPSLHHLVDDLVPRPVTATMVLPLATGTGGDFLAPVKLVRVRDEDGTLRGTWVTWKPAAGMDVLGMMALERDLDYLERTRSMTVAARRPAAILFADLERSSLLARSLSTARNFTLGRRIVRATDRSVVAAGGLVGTHAGDGVVGFFPAELFESVSAAARACIQAARDVRTEIVDVAERSELAPEDLVMRFGLHWGSTIYIGNISTAARVEVTALGDEVNEAARIEACATDGLMLASKGLIERLTDGDASALGIDPDRITYTRLADLATATDKARRDAPAISVCEL
jgi:class 3 adenylate cyclase